MAYTESRYTLRDPYLLTHSIRRYLITRLITIACILILLGADGDGGIFDNSVNIVVFAVSGSLALVILITILIVYKFRLVSKTRW